MKIISVQKMGTRTAFGYTRSIETDIYDLKNDLPNGFEVNNVKYATESLPTDHNTGRKVWRLYATEDSIPRIETYRKTLQIISEWIGEVSDRGDKTRADKLSAFYRKMVANLGQFIEIPEEKYKWKTIQTAINESRFDFKTLTILKRTLT